MKHPEKQVTTQLLGIFGIKSTACYPTQLLDYRAIGLRLKHFQFEEVFQALLRPVSRSSTRLIISIGSKRTQSSPSKQSVIDFTKKFRGSPTKSPFR